MKKFREISSKFSSIIVVLFAVSAIGITFYPDRAEAKYGPILLEFIKVAIEVYDNATSHDYSDPAWILDQRDCTIEISCPDGGTAWSHGTRIWCSSGGNYACTPEPCNAPQPQC